MKHDTAVDIVRLKVRGLTALASSPVGLGGAVNLIGQYRAWLRKHPQHVNYMHREDGLSGLHTVQRDVDPTHEEPTTDIDA